MSHSAENFRKEILLFLRKFLVSKKIWMKKGVSRFSVENFLSHSAKKIRGHPLNVSENLGYRKTLCILGGITFFRRKFFVSQCWKISWAYLQSFRKFGVSKNFMHTRGYHVFPSKVFCLTVPINLVGEPFCAVFQKSSGIEKVWIRGGSRFSVGFCLTVLKYFIGEHFGASEKFFHRKFSCIGGGHHGFVGTFCLTGPKRKAF